MNLRALALHPCSDSDSYIAVNGLNGIDSRSPRTPTVYKKTRQSSATVRKWVWPFPMGLLGKKPKSGNEASE